MQHRDQDQRDVDERDREARAASAAARKLTGPGERDGEEAGDEDPRQRLAQQVDQVQRQRRPGRSISTMRRTTRALSVGP